MPNSIQNFLKRNTGRARKIGRVITACIYGKSGLDERPEAHLGDNKSYTRFVIITHARTGSSTMITMLGKHTGILTFGEIFRGDQISYNIDGFDNHSKKLLALRQTYPVEFLQRQIFPAYPDSMKAVGFKLFPEQVNSRSFRPAWKALIADKSIRVIVLSRENLLAYYCSELIANKTKVFGIANTKDRKDTTIHIDFDTCLAKFQSRAASHSKVLQDFQAHKLLEISYEEMTHDMERSFFRLQEFLGVEQQSLSEVGIKKENRPLSSIIENYTELKFRFTNTEWSHLFVE